MIHFKPFVPTVTLPNGDKSKTMENIIKHIDPFLGEIELKKVDETNNSMMGHHRVDALYVYEHNERKLYFHYILSDIDNPQIMAISDHLIDLIKKNI